MLIQEIAQQLVAPGKGILAADESTGTIQKRFDSIGVASTEETRRAYRELLFTTVGIENYISGVILYDETIRQSTKDGVLFSKFLLNKGILPGIKVDTGAKPLAGADGETLTEGLDGLLERLKEYKDMGAAFAKWRAVIAISDVLPSERAIRMNAEALAGYAALCQEAGIVPIVEPEVLMEGTHTIERCFEVTKMTLVRVFDELKKQQVQLDGILLKPNMVIAGDKSPVEASPETVAEMTVKCFLETVPVDVPGIVFLSGGQSEAEACVHLQAMNAMDMVFPWELSFSYGRALQSSALKAWGGKPENVPAAQAAFLRRAKLVSAARSGTYSGEME